MKANRSNYVYAFLVGSFLTALPFLISVLSYRMPSFDLERIQVGSNYLLLFGLIVYLIGQGFHIDIGPWIIGSISLVCNVLLSYVILRFWRERRMKN